MMNTSPNDNALLRRSPRIAKIKSYHKNKKENEHLEKFSPDFIKASEIQLMNKLENSSIKGNFQALYRRKRRSSEKIVVLNHSYSIEENACNKKISDHQSSSDSGFQSAYEAERQNFLDHSILGLPHDIQIRYKEKRKIDVLYDWQKECLTDERLLNCSNMILSLPTGAGKTLIAEFLMLREAIVNKKDCILILPYVAIVQEKIQSLAVFEECFGIHVEEYAASKGRIPPIKRRDAVSMYICTIEKANMLINSLIENDRLNKIGLIVIDELHMLGEGSRGAILEQCLTKFIVRQKKQIIGMSATLSNLNEIASFLNAYVYETNFKPVCFLFFYVSF